jgi:ElaA protein
MELNYTLKPFSDLTLEELYELLRLRSEIFVVEQTCIYQDIDRLDYGYFHVLGKNENDELISYARVSPSDENENIKIGRVVVDNKFRGQDLGKELMKKTMELVVESFNVKSFSLSGQYHLKKFYNDLGFTEEGEQYLEDGIPHIYMIKQI